MVDNDRKDKLLQLTEQVRAARRPDADPEKIKRSEGRCSLGIDGRLQHFERLIKLKQYKSKMERCFPFKRFDSCNHQLDDCGPEQQYLPNRYVSTLLAPEDRFQVSINLSWINLWDCELKVKVVTRVPAGSETTLVRRPLQGAVYKLCSSLLDQTCICGFRGMAPQGQVLGELSSNTEEALDEW